MPKMYSDSSVMVDVSMDKKQEVISDAVKVDFDSEIPLTTKGECNEMPLRKVTLYKNNVAFYTRYGNIDEDHVIELSFPDDQADRVVKTLKLKDYGEGTVTVQYRTDETDMQGNFFERVGVGNYEQILNALRGIAVEVSSCDPAVGVVSGICVGTSPIELLAETKMTKVTVVHLLTPDNELQGIRVCDIAKMKILDDKVANDFSYFIRGVPQTKQTKKKKIALSCQGSGTRRVECSYVGQGFQWSAQYRILFSNHVDPYVGEYQWQYLSDEYQWVPFPSEAPISPAVEVPEPTGMAVSNARDEDMTMFTVRKPVTLAKNRAALVEMFESDLIDARKLVVCGLAPYSLANGVNSRIDCKNGIFMTNTTGHGLENGLCSVVDSTQDVYMGEGYLACKQDGVAIVTYANERTLHVEGQIIVPENGVNEKYDNGTLTLLTLTGKVTEDIGEAYQLKVAGQLCQTTKYTIENSSRRNYPWVMIYHNSFGELESPKERFITFGRSDLHAKKRRFVCSVTPSTKKVLEVVEKKKFDRTLNLQVAYQFSEKDYKTWIEDGLIDEAFAKKIKARITDLQPQEGWTCRCSIS